MKQVRVWLAVAAFATALWLAPRRTTFASISMPPPDSYLFRVTLGLGDKSATDWSGSLRLEGHSQASLEGFRFLENDRITAQSEEGVWRWKLSSEPTVPRSYQKQLLPNDPLTSFKGLTIRVRGVSARVNIETPQGRISFAAAGIPLGRRQSFLNGSAAVERLPVSVVLSAEPRNDDYPSVSVTPDGTVWAAWMSYQAGRDGILLARMRNGEWRGPVEVPETSGDVWWPHAAADGAGNVWVVWSQQVNGNFDLYARPMRNDRWGDLIRLTNHASPDINPSLAHDSEGTLYVVWQGFRGSYSSIFLRTLKNGTWQPEVRVSNAPANDWFPQIAACSKPGRVWITWDSYRTGNYDVFARSFEGTLGPELAVTSSPLYEADASIACDASGAPWVAYNTSGPNWAKDNGYLIRQKQPGMPMGATREVRVRAYRDGNWQEPAASPQDSLPAGDRSLNFVPKIAADSAGRIWLVIKHRNLKPPTAGVDSHSGFYFESLLTWFDGSKWADAVPLPDSWERLSARYNVAVAQGGLWAVWSTDGRKFHSPNDPVSNVIHASFLPAPASPVTTAALRPPAQDKIEVRPGHKDETGDVAALRAYRASVAGMQLRILRGDMHRHTELSVDVSAPDGSVIDFFRYMLDVARMDFSGPTDHQGGGGYDYWWWLTQKLDDLYHVPGAYVPVYGYERSLAYPFGHKNIFHSYRGARVVPFFYKYEVRPWVKDAPGNDRNGVEGRSVVENETELLYEQLRKSKGIAMSHTAATHMGNDWHAWDKEVEPAVEIYQGARTVYEEQNGPGAARKGVDDAQMLTQGYEPAGFLWNALQKGYRLGIQASSDHNSTHISYTLVYTDDPTREGILNAIRKRHLYGATDNILVDFRMGPAFMGDEIAASAIPSLSVKIRGTAEVARVVVVRDNQYVYTASPKKQEATVTFQDRLTAKGVHYYYVRVEQADGQLAWSSPIWINLK